MNKIAIEAVKDLILRSDNIEIIPSNIKTAFYSELVFGKQFGDYAEVIADRCERCAINDIIDTLIPILDHCKNEEYIPKFEYQKTNPQYYIFKELISLCIVYEFVCNNKNEKLTLPFVSLSKLSEKEKEGYFRNGESIALNILFGLDSVRKSEAMLVYFKELFGLLATKLIKFITIQCRESLVNDYNKRHEDIKRTIMGVYEE